jgi:hypothetical protein
MASKYRKRYTVPDGFNQILEDLSREILREQPRNIVHFAASYFKSKAKGEPFIWEDPNPRGPKPCDYNKRIQTTSSDKSQLD